MHRHGHGASSRHWTEWHSSWGHSQAPCPPPQPMLLPITPRCQDPKLHRAPFSVAKMIPSQKSQACHGFGELGRGGAVGQGGWSRVQHRTPWLHQRCGAQIPLSAGANPHGHGGLVLPHGWDRPAGHRVAGERQDHALHHHRPGGIANPPSLGEGSKTSVPTSPRPMAYPHQPIDAKSRPW